MKESPFFKMVSLYADGKRLTEVLVPKFVVPPDIINFSGRFFRMETDTKYIEASLWACQPEAQPVPDKKPTAQKTPPKRRKGSNARASAL